MTRKECLDKIQEVVDNLDTLLAVIKSPSSTTIRWDCEVYADEADKNHGCAQCSTDQLWERDERGILHRIR